MATTYQPSPTPSPLERAIRGHDIALKLLEYQINFTIGRLKAMASNNDTYKQPINQQDRSPYLLGRV